MGSTAELLETAAGAAIGAALLGACFRACRCEEPVPAAGGLGLAAAAAAAPGKTGPVGSGFMILTGGIEAAVGKSILTGLWLGCGVASATSAPALQAAA